MPPRCAMPYPAPPAPARTPGPTVGEASLLGRQGREPRPHLRQGFPGTSKVPLAHLPPDLVLWGRGGELALPGCDLLGQLPPLLLERLSFVPGPGHGLQGTRRGNRPGGSSEHPKKITYPPGHQSATQAMLASRSAVSASVRATGDTAPSSCPRVVRVRACRAIPGGPARSPPPKRKWLI